MANRPLTKKEWMAYLEKACDEFDWEGASKPCPNCEYHKNRAARWRAEAYKQAGHDVIELPWVGLTDEDCKRMSAGDKVVAMWADRTLKEKNT